MGDQVALSTDELITHSSPARPSLMLLRWLRAEDVVLTIAGGGILRDLGQPVSELREPQEYI